MSHSVINEVRKEDIEFAFSQGLFSMVYQPQVHLAKQTDIIGAEAFVRFNHPEYGMMMPASFLPLINEMGLMLDLTRYVLNCVASDWAEWNQKGSDLNISVNIDSNVLQAENLGKELGRVLSDHDIPRRKITLEFANCWPDGQVKDDIGKKLLGLRMKGYRLSIDDYGRDLIDDKVFSELPIDEIKLDRSVTSGLLEQAENQQCCKHALRLANRYGLRLIAVGLEDATTSNWLANIGCDGGQGYYFGKPLNSTDFFDTYISAGDRTVIDNTKNSILIIEDDPQYQNLLSQSLGELYTLRIAGTVEEAVKLIDTFSPNIIISDVHLPDGSGIDFCKQHVDTNLADVIFISGGLDFDNKIQAYEVGASDFIHKPFSIIELVAKITQVSNYQARRQELITHADNANKMVMQSLKETAYFGDIVQFLKRLLVCQDEGQISRELFSFMGQKTLYTSIEFRDGNNYINFDQMSGACSPIELNIFELLREKGRLYPFGQRLLVNDSHVSFLVKNMPEDETEEGKIRDYVAVLIEGMEARYKEILRQRVLNNVTQKLETLTHKLLAIVNDDQSKKNELLNKYSFELQMSFHTLDLSEDQEEKITTIINEMLKTKESEEQASLDMGEEVNSILDSMKGSIKLIDASDEKSDLNSNVSVELF